MTRNGGARMIKQSEFLPGVMDGIEVTPLPCRCGGDASVIPPGEQNSWYTVFCGKEPFKHRAETGKTERDAISNWNEMQGRVEL